MVIIEVKVGTEKEEVIIIIIEKFVIGIRTLKLNLFGLVARVSRCEVYRRKLKLIAAYLTIL